MTLSMGRLSASASDAPVAGFFVGRKNKRPEGRLKSDYLAEQAGFEPAEGYEPSHAFQACDLNRSSTAPDLAIVSVGCACIFCPALVDRFPIAMFAMRHWHLWALSPIVTFWHRI